uniref:Nudix hydrolase domain-containing protein n=1 Tax=Parastrongyloides trichosuri TaxID=131310 RepID=A0A0N5A2P8_PARTI
MSKNNKEECPYILWDDKIVYEGRWLRAKQISFKKGENGIPGIWQIAERATKPKDVDVAGICIFGILKKDGKKYLVLIKQYRIPLKAWCIELPAGLVDKEKESIREAGLRELKEETGYTISKVLVEPKNIQTLNPGLTDDSVQYMVVEIDGDDEINMNPKQNLEEHECIEVILIETDKVYDYLEDLGNTVQVQAPVYTFALALKFNSLFL